ncbi:HGxxPAAW family protein [Streptomyces maoxianensis]|uniref:HGxxPAAW family protein n=1 Tax=Streptomyces maoxianensis TaxID=1459942 RepID=A0ABV9GCF8_9ACTN
MSGTSHGHTPAAWTGVTIAVFGFCIAGIFMVAANPLGFWAGVAVILLGGVVGGAMKAAGLGMPKESEAHVLARSRASQAQTVTAQPATAQPATAQTAAAQPATAQASS